MTAKQDKTIFMEENFGNDDKYGWTLEATGANSPKFFLRSSHNTYLWFDKDETLLGAKLRESQSNEGSLVTIKTWRLGMDCTPRISVVAAPGVEPRIDASPVDAWTLPEIISWAATVQLRAEVLFALCVIFAGALQI